MVIDIWYDVVVVYTNDKRLREISSPIKFNKILNEKPVTNSV